MIECEQKIGRMKCSRAIGDRIGRMLWRDGRCDQEINERMIHWMIYLWVIKINMNECIIESTGSLVKEQMNVTMN